MNEYPLPDEDFIVREKYSFNPKGFTQNHRAIIDVEIYKHNICVISFYPKSSSLSEYKYEKRLNCGTGYALAIIKASLQIYLDVQNVDVLVFNASNDVGKIEDDNKRYSAYLKVIENYIPNFNSYYKTGSIKLNTFMIYPLNYKHKEAAKVFFEKYEGKVAGDLLDRAKKTKRK